MSASLAVSEEISLDGLGGAGSMAVGYPGRSGKPEGWPGFLEVGERLKAIVGLLLR